jgi:D-tyrosyl-tRNA(Tyr) deacylase
MKAVVQRCRAAGVCVESEVVGEIEFGLTVFVAALEGDDESNAARLAQKIAALRIFSNADGKFDLNVRDVGGSVLVISNFTLAGETKKGNRPSFSAAARPERAESLVDTFATLLATQNICVATGRFGAHMKVTVENDGPVTILLET